MPSEQPSSIFQPQPGTLIVLKMAPSGKVSLTRRAEGRSPSSWLNCPTAFLLGPATNRHSLVALLLKHTQTRTHTMLHKANCPLACQS